MAEVLILPEEFHSLPAFSVKINIAGLEVRKSIRFRRDEDLILAKKNLDLKALFLQRREIFKCLLN